MGSRFRPAHRIQSPIGRPESGFQILYILYIYTIFYMFYTCFFISLHNHFILFVQRVVNKTIDLEPCCPMFCKYDHIWNPAYLSDVKTNGFGTRLPNMM